MKAGKSKDRIANPNKKLRLVPDQVVRLGRPKLPLENGVLGLFGSGNTGVYITSINL